MSTNEVGFDEDPFDGNNVDTYKEGQDGPYEKYHKNGKIDYRVNYKNGKLDGMMTTWLYYGEIESERNYVDGELDGDVTWWNSPIN